MLIIKNSGTKLFLLLRWENVSGVVLSRFYCNFWLSSQPNLRSIILIIYTSVLKLTYWGTLTHINFKQNFNQHSSLRTTP
jgi:hypothetical protein